MLPRLIQANLAVYCPRRRVSPSRAPRKVAACTAKGTAARCYVCLAPTTLGSWVVWDSNDRTDTASGKCWRWYTWNGAKFKLKGHEGQHVKWKEAVCVATVDEGGLPTLSYAKSELSCS